MIPLLCRLQRIGHARYYMLGLDQLWYYMNALSSAADYQFIYSWFAVSIWYHDIVCRKGQFMYLWRDVDDWSILLHFLFSCLFTALSLFMPLEFSITRVLLILVMFISAK